MKYFLIFLISFYQRIFSPFIEQTLGIGGACRFSPTCSSYAKNIIESEGVVKGAKKSLLRLLRCQPFFEK